MNRPTAGDGWEVWRGTRQQRFAVIVGAVVLVGVVALVRMEYRRSAEAFRSRSRSMAALFRWPAWDGYVTSQDREWLRGSGVGETEVKWIRDIHWEVHGPRLNLTSSGGGMVEVSRFSDAQREQWARWLAEVIEALEHGRPEAAKRVIVARRGF